MKLFSRSNKQSQVVLSTPKDVHKHPFVIPIVAFLVVFFGLCIGFIGLSGGSIDAEDSKVVKLYVDGKVRDVPTHAPTVKQLLERLDIKLAAEDVVEPNINSPILSDNFSVNVYRSRPITIIDENGQRTSARVAESTAFELAKKAGVKVYPEDKVNFGDPDKAVEDGVVGDLITIDRAVPATINLYGKNIPVRTHAATVGDLLKEKNIQTLKGDTVTPATNTPITENARIFILRKGKKIVTREEVIPAPVETEYDATMKVGEQRVVDPGLEGKRVVTYEVKLENGREVSRKEIQSVVSVEPQVRKVIQGTKAEGFEGGFASALASLRSCEGSYTSNTGNGYYGAYQFDVGTWGGFGGYPNAAAAPPAVQDQKARQTYEARGWSPWPACSNSLGLQDIYR